MATADREAVDQQGAGVVEEAFAFQHDDDAVRQLQLPQDGGRRRCVRRGHDRAQRDRRGPAEAGHQRVRDEGDRGYGECHRAEREARDRHDVLAQIAGRGVVRGVEEGRRDEQRQGELRVERDLGHAGYQGQRGAGQRQQRRVGHAEPAGPQREQRTDEQQGDYDFEDEHLNILLAPFVLYS